MLTNYRAANAFGRLCHTSDENGATVRLARNDAGWGIVVTLPPAHEGHQPRAAGFFFDDIDELDQHSTYMLAWLSDLEQAADVTA